jgi:hypothetical protein
MRQILLQGVSGSTSKMINTFENAYTFHTRRLERERHLANMDIFSKVIEHDDDVAVSSMVDAIAGFPLAKSDGQQNNTTRKVAPFFFLCFAGLVVLAVVGILSAWGGMKYEDKSTTQGETGSAASLDSNVRFQRFFSIVLDWGLTTRIQLEDNFSPPRKALNWLVEVDAQTTNPEDIRTRYALATLYFGTQNSSAGYVWTWSTYWLSEYPVCLWYGVYCHQGGWISVGRVGALNLSSNGN